MTLLDRRTLLAGGGLLLAAACTRKFASPERAGTLPIPRLIDARQQGQLISLQAQRARPRSSRAGEAPRSDIMAAISARRCGFIAATM